MAVKKLRPITPGQRFRTAPVFDEITASTPEKSLVTSMKRSGGRNNQGRMTMRYLGGGHKKSYRIIDFKRRKHDKTEEQEDINKKDLKTKWNNWKNFKIKDFLSGIFSKKRIMGRKTEYRKKEEKEYKDLENQIKKLGVIMETEKQGKNGLFGRIFRKK